MKLSYALQLSCIFKEVSTTPVWNLIIMFKQIEEHKEIRKRDKPFLKKSHYWVIYDIVQSWFMYQSTVLTNYIFGYKIYLVMTFETWAVVAFKGIGMIRDKSAGCREGVGGDWWFPIEKTSIILKYYFIVLIQANLHKGNLLLLFSQGLLCFLVCEGGS